MLDNGEIKKQRNKEIKDKKKQEELEVIVGGEEGGVDQTGVGETIAGVSIQRYKGLGEMNPTQLWDTTMNPKTRILKKVNMEDAVIADETFSMLMGDLVAPRRKFIETNANIAEVDI